MPYSNSSVDGASLFFRDYPPSSSLDHGANAISTKPALVFLHGWPMSSKMYEHLLVPLCETHGFRYVAPDRREFGNIDWTGSQAKEGFVVDYDTFADDLIQITKGLKMESGFVFVGASMGCGEAVRAFMRSEYIRQHCKGMLFLGPSLPFPLQTADNPTAPPRELWDAILAGIREDRPTFVQVSLPNVFGAHVGVETSPAQLNRYQLIVEAADDMAIERCVRIITATDFTDELGVLGSKYDLPVDIIHGDSDNGMPVEASAELVQKLIPRSDMKIYKKSGHGMYLTHKEECLADIFAFANKCTKAESSKPSHK